MNRVFCVIGFLVSVGMVRAEQPVVLSPSEQVMVEAVMAWQRQATAACLDLSESKRYRELSIKAQTALQSTGKTINWATGMVSAKDAK